MSYVNVVVLTGRLSRPAMQRALPSGDRLVALEVTVPREGERADTVPVAWMRAPARAAELETDEEVLVVGRVRRRFWRGGEEGPRSRTEVLAEAVVPLRQARRCRSALVAGLDRAADALQVAPVGTRRAAAGRASSGRVARRVHG